MRLFYSHTPTWEVAVATFRGISINMRSLTDMDNRTDVFCRVMYRAASGKNNMYLCTSLAAAEAIEDELTDAADKTAAGVCGYHENFTLDGTERTFTITNHAAVTPDLDGIVIKYDGAGSETDWDAVFGIDSAPEAVLLEDIVAMLQARTSSGQALEGFDVQAGPVGGVIMSANESILCIGLGVDAAAAAHRDFALGTNLSLLVGRMGPDLGGASTTTQLFRDAGKVRSILFDEHRYLDDFRGEIVYQTTTGPEKVEGEEEPYLALEVQGLVRFHDLQSDKE